MAGAAGAAELTSPNGKLVVAFDTADSGALQYRVSYDGKPILAESRLGLELQEAPALSEGFRIVKLSSSTHDEMWTPIYGERSSIRDHYKQLIVDLDDGQDAPRRLRLVFRAYDEGIAFCYVIPKQHGWEQIHIAKEESEFRFSDDHTAWAVYSAQGRYAEVPLSGVKPGCERPLTIQVDEDTFVALAEARLVDYARMKLAPLKGVPHALISSLSGSVQANLPLTTPWRVVMVADSPARLLENNDIILNLNDPCEIKDTSWIKPGKVIREVTLRFAC